MQGVRWMGGDKYTQWSPGARNNMLVNSWVITKSGGHNNWRIKGVILTQYILPVFHIMIKQDFTEFCQSWVSQINIDVLHFMIEPRKGLRNL